MKPQRLRRAETDNRFAGLTPEDLTEPESEALIELALRALAVRHRPGQALASPAETRAYLRLWLGERPSEVYGCLFLDNRHRVLRVEELFQGTIDGASVHSREVVRRALQTNAAAVIFVHNHPSGVAEPSQADVRITQHLKEALALVGIRVLDHVVVGAQDSVSLAERALI